MLPEDRNERVPLAVLAVVGLATLAYGVVIRGTLLPGLYAVLLLAFLYLFWRFVRAAERVAAALEGGE